MNKHTTSFKERDNEDPHHSYPGHRCLPSDRLHHLPDAVDRHELGHLAEGRPVRHQRAGQPAWQCPVRVRDAGDQLDEAQEHAVVHHLQGLQAGDHPALLQGAEAG